MPRCGQNPFVGPRPLELGEQLYGRQRELTELYYRLSAERIVLLHSPSGAGKSSLVQAGLVPRLRERFDVWRPVRVNEDVPEGVDANRYVFSVLRSFEEGIPEENRKSIDALAELSLHRYVQGRVRRPGAPENKLLIFDQFEEILTTDPLNVEAKKEFFDELGDTLRDPGIWALFVLREDYLAPLDPYARQVPTHLRNRYRMDLLNLEGARDAMVRSAEDGRRSFPAVDQLLHDLATVKVQQPDGSFQDQEGSYVEPVQLQVVCHKLWTDMEPEDLSIDAEDLDAFGNVNEALGAYYASAVHGAAEDIQEEREIRDWFDRQLITAGDIRAQVLREEEASSGLRNGLIERLRDRHLVRAEHRAGATWYELAHDRLVEPVRENNRQWRQEHLDKWQQRAILWEEQGRPPGLLLGDEDFRAVMEGEEKPSLDRVDKDFIAASVAAQVERKRKRRQERRFRLLGIFASVVAILALVAMWAAFRQRMRAEEETEKARALFYTAAAGSLVRSDEALLGALVALEIREPDTTPTANRVYHDALANRQKTLFRGHRYRVTSASFSPDGRHLLTTARDDAARIWDVSRGELLYEMTPYQVEKERLAGVTSAAWDRGGDRVLASYYKSRGDGSFLGGAAIWDVARNVPLISFPVEGAEPLARRVHHAAWSPDEKMIVTSSDGGAQIWDAETGEKREELEPEEWRNIQFSLWSPDGEYILTITEVLAQVWRVADGRGPLLLEHEENIRHAAWYPEGRRLVTVHESHDVMVWTIDEDLGLIGEPERFQHKLADPNYEVFHVAWSPDGQSLLTAADGVAEVWRNDFSDRWPSFTHLGSVSQAFWSPEGTRVLTGSDSVEPRFWKSGLRLPTPMEGRITKIWSTVTGQEMATLEGGNVVGWSARGDQVVATDDALVRVYNARPGEIIHTLESFAWNAHQLAWSSTGDRLLTSDKSAMTWDVLTGERLEILLDGQYFKGSSWSPNGGRVLTYSPEGVRIWDADTGVEDGAPIRASGLWSARWSPDGQHILVVMFDAFQVWTSEGEFVCDTGEHDDIDHASWSPDSRRLLTASPTVIYLWDAKSCALLKENQEGHGSGYASLQSGVTYTAWSPDGKIFLTASRDETVKIWDGESGIELQHLVGHSDVVEHAAWSSDGERVLTSSSDRTARLWDAESGEEIHVLLGHTGSVIQGAWSRDGRVLTVGEDKTVRLWDAETGEAVYVFTGHREKINDAAWDPTGKMIASASEDGTVKIWAAGGGDHLQARIRASARRCLSVDFRMNNLGESEDVAERRYNACEACVPSFFATIDSVPRGAVRAYEEAWRSYRSCLDDKGYQE